MFNGRSTVKDQPFCRTLWSVDSLIWRAEFTSVCCGDAHWCILKFRDCAVLLQVGVSIIFHFVRTACGVLLWLGPWSKMTRNSSVDDCASTDDSPTLARSVGFRCIFRCSTHVRNDRTAAAIAHLKVPHACDIVAPFRRQCRVTAAMSAPQRSLRGAVCCLNMFSVSYVCYS